MSIFEAQMVATARFEDHLGVPQCESRDTSARSACSCERLHIHVCQACTMPPATHRHHQVVASTTREAMKTSSIPLRYDYVEIHSQSEIGTCVVLSESVRCVLCHGRFCAQLLNRIRPYNPGVRVRHSHSVVSYIQPCHIERVIMSFQVG